MKRKTAILLIALVGMLLTACITVSESSNTVEDTKKEEKRVSVPKSEQVAEETKEETEEKTQESSSLQGITKSGKKIDFTFVEVDGLEGVEIFGLLYAQRPMELGGDSHMPISNTYLAMKDGKYGLLNHMGEWICEPEYAQITYSYDFFLEPDLEYDSDKYSIDEDGNIYKLSDPHSVTGTCGDPVSVWAINEAKMMLTYGGDACIMDENFVYDGTVAVSEVIYTGKEDGTYIPTENYAYAVCTDGKLKTGFMYETAAAFSDGLMAVRKDGKWGYVNEQGEEVIPCMYDPIRFDRTEYLEKEFMFAPACMHGYVVLSKDGEYALADFQGAILIPFGEYEALTEMQGIGMYAKKDGKWGYLVCMSQEEYEEHIFHSQIGADEDVLDSVYKACSVAASDPEVLDAPTMAGYIDTASMNASGWGQEVFRTLGVSDITAVEKKLKTVPNGTRISIYMDAQGNFTVSAGDLVIPNN